MSLKPCSLVLIFLIGNIHLSIAQTKTIDKEVQRVGYLVEYNQYDEAEKKADSILLLLKNKDKKHLEYKLQLLLQKGIMYEIKEENSRALEVLLQAVDQAESNKFYKIACHTNIILALIYEKEENSELAKKYLDVADRIRIKHHLEELYSTILIRRSLYHRWFTENVDSAMYYTQKALLYAQKYNNGYDIAEASLMIGNYYGEYSLMRNDTSLAIEAIPYFSSAADYYIKTNNYTKASMMYGNISGHYRYSGLYDHAKIYSDSGFALIDKVNKPYQLHILTRRFRAFESLNKLDSALFYLKWENTLNKEVQAEEEAASIKKITEQYQNDKKEGIIKSRNQLLIFITVFTFLIIITSLLLFFQNRKIKKQNNTIQLQLEEQQKLSNQKQVLLSELQHRVKNNLQQVISILEIQKESIDFSNIEELVRANQNRIHSMALLHKKLNITDNINSIDFDNYLQELTELVADSYFDESREIRIFNQTSLGKTNIETALPLGLIIVELISNSLKHAFLHQKEGCIKISLNWNQELQQHQLMYSDNGSGFDFKPTEKKGLGIEIIQGLIDQLNGTFKVNGTSGFNITILF